MFIREITGQGHHSEPRWLAPGATESPNCLTVFLFLTAERAEPAGASPGAQPQLVVAESDLTNGGLGPGGGRGGTRGNTQVNTTTDFSICCHCVSQIWREHRSSRLYFIPTQV